MWVEFKININEVKIWAENILTHAQLLVVYIIWTNLRKNFQEKKHVWMKLFNWEHKTWLHNFMFKTKWLRAVYLYSNRQKNHSEGSFRSRGRSGWESLLIQKISSECKCKCLCKRLKICKVWIHNAEPLFDQFI